MQTVIFYPVFAQIALTLILLIGTGWHRRLALKGRAVRFADVALDDNAWPDYARKFANCYRNQFELPVVFYVLCAIAYVTAHVDALMVALAWGFVITRLVHAYIHTTSNIVLRRGAAFLGGFLIVIGMLALLFVRMSFAVS